MDKTRKIDIFKFVAANGYKILRIYSMSSEGEEIVLELQKGNISGLVNFHVTNTEFNLEPSVGLKFQECDWSEQWMVFLASEHPEMVEVLVSEIDNRKNEFTEKMNAQLKAIKDEYTRVYNYTCAEGNRLNDIKKSLLEKIQQPQEQK